MRKERLEELEEFAKECNCSDCKEIIELTSEVHRLRDAIEQAILKSQYSGFARMEALEELKKALE